MTFLKSIRKACMFRLLENENIQEVIEQLVELLPTSSFPVQTIIFDILHMLISDYKIDDITEIIQSIIDYINSLEFNSPIADVAAHQLQILFNKLPENSPIISITIKDFEDKTSSSNESERLISIILYEILIPLLPEQTVLNYFIQFLCDPSVTVRKKLYSILLNKTICPPKLYNLIIHENNQELIKKVDFEANIELPMDNDIHNKDTNKDSNGNKDSNNNNNSDNNNKMGSDFVIPLVNNDIFNAEYLNSNRYLYYCHRYSLNPQTVGNKSHTINDIRNISDLENISKDQIDYVANKMIDKCEIPILSLIFGSNKELGTNVINFYYNKILSLYQEFKNQNITDSNLELLLFYSHIYTLLLSTLPQMIKEDTEYYLDIIIELIEFLDSCQVQCIYIYLFIIL